MTFCARITTSAAIALTARVSELLSLANQISVQALKDRHAGSSDVHVVVEQTHVNDAKVIKVRL